MTAINYHRLLSRLVNRPLLTTGPRALSLLGLLAPRSGLSDLPVDFAGMAEGGRALSDFAATLPRLTGPRDDRRAYRVVDGVAVIPIQGDLVGKLGTLDPFCGMTGYDGITAKIDQAEADPEVRGIAFEIDSPGGEVQGCLECGTAIARATKPTRALVWEACSAAYWLAAQTDWIAASAAAALGSVGVISLHMDQSRAMNQRGLTVTVLRAGILKAEGDSFTPLSDDAQHRAIADMQALRLLFADAVAAGRGLDRAAVLDTEAAVYLAEPAKALGLIDDVMSPDDGLAHFIAALDQAGTATTKPAKSGATGVVMSKSAIRKPTKSAAVPATPEDDENTPPAEDDEAKPGDNSAPKPDPADQAEDDEAEAPAESAPSDKPVKARIAAILGSAQAKGRDDLAKHLALNTDLSAKAAIAALAAAPKTIASVNPFAAAMAANAGPDLGAGGDVGRSDGWDRSFAKANPAPRAK